MARHQVATSSEAGRVTPSAARFGVNAFRGPSGPSVGVHSQDVARFAGHVRIRGDAPRPRGKPGRKLGVTATPGGGFSERG